MNQSDEFFPTNTSPGRLGQVPSALRSHREFLSETGYLVLDASREGVAKPLDDTILDSHHLPLRIYAENIRLPSSIHAQGHLGVYAHTFEFPEADQITFSVSGANGDLISANGRPADGGDGGRLECYVEELDENALGKLRFESRGGLGAPPNVQESPVGKGGTGGSILLFFGGKYTQVLALGRAILDDHACAATEDEAIKHLQRRRISLMDFVDLVSELGSISDIPGLKQPLDCLRLHLSLDWQNYPLPDERLHIKNILSLIDNKPVVLKADSYSHIDVSGGSGYCKKDEKVVAANGADGSFEVEYDYGHIGQVLGFDAAIVHPIQVAMVLERVKLEYYSRQDLSACSELLALLLSRLSFLDYIAPDHPIYKAYGTAETAHAMCLQVGSEKLGSETLIPSIQSLIQVKMDAALIQRQMSSGVDFFGLALDYVPRLSYDSLSVVFEKMLGRLKDIEAANKEYFRLGQDRERRRQQVQKSLPAARGNLANRKEELPSIQDTVLQWLQSAKDLNAQMQAARKTLSERVKDVSAIIQNLQLSPGITFDDVVSAITYVVTVPAPPQYKAASAAGQAVGLLSRAITSAGIKDNFGRFVEKEFVIEDFVSIQATAESLLQGYEIIKSSDLSSDLEDPKAERLLASKNEFMTLLNQFKKAISKGNVQQLDRAFNKFVDATLARNNAVMQYNLALNKYVTTLQEISFFSNQLDAITEAALEIDGLDPSIPNISLFMERAYSDAMWMILESLYMTERALQYRLLSNEPIVGSLLGRGEEINHASLSRVMMTMLEKYTKGKDREGKAPNKFADRRYTLNEDELRTLKESKEVLTRIAPLKKGETDQYNGFHGMASVRLERVRFYMVGAKRPKGNITVFLTHMGEETFLTPSEKPSPRPSYSSNADANGNGFLQSSSASTETGPTREDETTDSSSEDLINFVHRPIRVQFRYQPKPDKSAQEEFNEQGQDLADGDLISGVDDPFAPIGPFALWWIECWEYNDGLDLSNVTEAYFIFNGTYHTL